MDRAGRLAERSESDHGAPALAGAHTRAQLRATFGPAGLVHAYVEAPWKLFGPIIAPQQHPAYYLTNTTAGILAGDQLRASFDVQPGVRLRLTSPSATRVHTMQPGEQASQRLHFTLGAGAALTYWPNQLIPFAGADYSQETTFHLAAGSSLVAADVLAPGRLGAGEAFAFTALRLATRIYLEQRLVLADQAVLRPAVAPPGRLGLWEGYTHVGSLYLAGAAALAADLDALAPRLEAGGLLAGISRPHPQVVVARVLGQGAEAVMHALGALAPGLH